MRHLPLPCLLACATDPSADAPATTTPETVGPVELSVAPLERLTATQYRNTVLHLLGGPLPAVPTVTDTNPYLFFSIGTATTEVAESDVQHLEEAAVAFAREVFTDPARREALVGCTPATPGDACVGGFLADFGRRAFRRPMTTAEHGRWRAVATDLADGDPWLGLESAVGGMLQSPSLLYRTHLGTADPDDPTRRRLDAWELASRLSFLLWDFPPDDTLLDAAAAGELDTSEGLGAQFDRLLADPRARGAIQDFFAQYLDLQRLDRVQRDTDLFPEFTDTLVPAMRTETQLLVDDLVFRRDTDIRELFTTRRTFVNTELATLYGLDAPGASSVAFVPVTLPEAGPRAGVLTLGAFLTMNAHEQETSPTLRGKYVRERVLCSTVPPPPDDVDLDLDASVTDESLTLREKLERHREDPACYGCHKLIDPPGLLFEHFDNLGRWREVYEDGHPIDASGELDNAVLADATELATLLQTDDRVAPCMVQQLFRHAHARLDTDADANTLAHLEAAFAAGGHRFVPLLRELVTHDSFRFVAEAP
jgi:hypothetical protein